MAYRLPELLKYPDGTVFVCEGEKDADRVASLDLCSTNVASGGWEQCAPVMTGRDVIILRDSDEAGAKRALEAATALWGKAKTIRVVGMPDGAKDVSVWLDLDPGNAAKLANLCFDVPPWVPSPEEPRTTSPDTIQIKSGNLREVVDQSEAALINAGTPFYARSGELVKPIIEDVAAFRGRRTKVPRLKVVNVDCLRDHLSRTVEYIRYDARQKKWVAANPPHEVASTLLSRDGDWKFRRLSGIITTPTLRPDGTILSEPGYDKSTGLLLVAALDMPPVLERPNRDDAVAALQLLDDLLAEFPFVDEASRSVALSALMTPVARGAMSCVPLHAVTAPEAGTGKSFLIDTACCIATGEIAPVIAAGRTEEETEKRLAAELMTGQPIISIDNLNGDLAGDFICQAVERPTIKPRILGRSETKRIDNTVTIFGNGNNFRLAGDMVRRVVLCSLDANLEQPEKRQFRSNPVATVLADRGRYVAAVLTIVRAYLVAGCPDPRPSLASFGEWSRLIRSSLVWLGRRDPVDTMEGARADDPVRSALREVVVAWRAVIGANNPVTAGEVKEKAFNSGGDDLLKAISAVACAPGRTEIDTVRLGRWLGRHKGRVLNGVKLQGRQDTDNKQMQWWLERIKNA